MIDRLVAPPIKDAVEFKLHLKPCDEFTLDNGVPVYAINAGAEEVLQLEMIFYAGNWFEKQKAVASATNSLLKNGTSTKTAFQINERFEYYGAYCNRACYNETAVVSLSTLNKHLPALLPVVKEMITDSVFSEDELSTFKQNSKQRLSVNLKKCDFVAGRLIDSYVYGEKHPYGTYTNPEDIDTLSTDQLKAFFQQYYVNGQVVIFISGKLPADIQQQLNNNFGGLSITGKKVTTIEHPIISAAEKKYRYFGSRLMSNIREDKGYTYGIHSFVQNHLNQSAWMVSTEAGKDVSEATIEEIYKEMKLLREELVGEEELMLVRNYLMGTILGDLDGPFQIIGRWKNIVLNGLTEKYFYDSIETIKNISAEELRELANKYLNPEDFYELVVI